MNRNRKSPWNPAYPADLTPEEYERQVVSWLRKSAESLDKFEVRHLEHLGGAGGDYEFDAVAEFRVFQGARIVVVVECKRYSQPVERDKLLSLWAKLQDVKAHKALMFATCGFQSGALTYARTHRIGTITFVEGAFLYETRAAGPPTPPPPGAHLPKYAGLFLRKEADTIHQTTLDLEDTEVLSEWLNS